MFDRVRQKPQHVRYALFWCLMICSTVILVGAWFLSFRSTVGSIAFSPEDREESPESANAGQVITQLGSLGATIGERWHILKEIIASQ